MIIYQSMQYKTRGSASPQGRPRVFFCCASADFERLFESVTDEILSIQKNAAIWYLPPEEGSMEGEAFLADLSQMQLLVVPVTTAFLRQEKPDPARTVAFSYAMEHHIPVLPLMQEPGLESLFNELCGELQILDKYALKSDPTALPYEEKLKRFLEGVLVTDELAERVRAAFDAYIFLSYRKKDRAAAQKIMRLIHENEFCRDVAIWYDEFLSPGENFNRAISDAMEKSTLFAMVVTPHLLEDPNYVLTTEYPAARDRKKAILPLEAEQTDAKELARLYDGLAQTLPTEDLEAISLRLKDLLTETALRENNDPAHTFLMGIAYLSGVDMEVNHDRAVELITKAAEAGLPEAMEKLVSMYKSGEGVERNSRTAIDWQRRLVNHCRAIAEADPDDLHYLNYFEALEDLCDQLTDAGDLAEAKTASHELSSCAVYMRDHEHVMTMWVVPESIRRVGNLKYRLGMHQEALQDYQTALDLLERSLSQTALAEMASRDYSEYYIKIANTHLQLKQYKQALSWTRKCVMLRERFYSETGLTEDLRGLYPPYWMMGRICLDMDDLDEALEWFQKALANCEKTIEQDGTDNDHSSLCEVYSAIGGVYYRKGDLQEALKWSEKMLAAAESLAVKTGQLAERRKVSVGCYDLGLICARLGDDEKALELQRRALRLCEALADEAWTAEIRIDLERCCRALGDLHLAQGDWQTALEWFQKQVTVCQALVKDSDTKDAQSDLGTAYERMGDADRPENSPEWYQKAFFVYEALVSETGTAKALDDLGVICFKLGRQELLPCTEREKYLNRLLQIGQQLLRETGQARYQQFIDTANQLLASL